MMSMVTGPRGHPTVRSALRWLLARGAASAALATGLALVAGSSASAAPLASVVGVTPHMSNAATYTTMSSVLYGGVQSFTAAAANAGGSGARSQSPLVAPIAQGALTLTSTSGTMGTALTLTSSGGSGTGAVTYAITSSGT